MTVFSAVVYTSRCFLLLLCFVAAVRFAISTVFVVAVVVIVVAVVVAPVLVLVAVAVAAAAVFAVVFAVVVVASTAVLAFVFAAATTVPLQYLSAYNVVAGAESLNSSSFPIFCRTATASSTAASSAW